VLSRRFNGPIAERIVQKLPEFLVSLEFDQYCELIEKLLNLETDRLLKIAFDVYDFNLDKLVCELDAYTMLLTFRDEEAVFLEAFSFDLCLIGDALEKKRQRMGISDYESFQKMHTV